MNAAANKPLARTSPISSPHMRRRCRGAIGKCPLWPLQPAYVGQLRAACRSRPPRGYRAFVYRDGREKPSCALFTDGRELDHHFRAPARTLRWWGIFVIFCNGDISLVARLQPTCYTYDPRCTMPYYTYDSFQSYSIICRLPCLLQRLALPIGCLLKVTRLGPKGHHRFRICIPQSLAHVVAYIGNI